MKKSTERVNAIQHVTRYGLLQQVTQRKLPGKRGPGHTRISWLKNHNLILSMQSQPFLRSIKAKCSWYGLSIMYIKVNSTDKIGSYPNFLWQHGNSQRPLVFCDCYCCCSSSNLPKTEGLSLQPPRPRVLAQSRIQEESLEVQGTGFWNLILPGGAEWKMIASLRKVKIRQTLQQPIRHKNCKVPPGTIFISISPF